MVAKYKIQSVVADQMKEMARTLKTLEVLDEEGKPIGSGWKHINWSNKFWYIPDKRAKGLNLYWIARNNIKQNVWSVGLIYKIIAMMHVLNGVSSSIRARRWTNDFRLTPLEQMQD